MPVNTVNTRPSQRVKVIAACGDTPGVSRPRGIPALGRLEAVRASNANFFIDGLSCATGLSSLVENPCEVTSVSALSAGATCLLTPNGKELSAAPALSEPSAKRL